MTDPIIEDTATTGGMRTHILILIIYAALTVLFYSPVVVGQKSLNPALYQPHGVTAAGVYGEKGRTPVNSFNTDLATRAFYEFPINKLVGDMYRARRAPLWNPYQAGGTPLAAQYTTRAFFPYQIAEDISPVRYWDYFMLGRLFIAGFFTYLFIIALGAGPWSAFIGGLFYMFSGAFTWFINLEQLANTAMMLPILLLSMEALARPAPRAQWVKVKIVIGAAVFALTLLAGQPETALYVLALAFLYYVFRAIAAHGLVRGVKILPRLGFSFVTGLLLSMPLILPFIELLRRGGLIYPGGVGLGLDKLVSWQTLFNVITPSLSYFPAGPGTAGGTGLVSRAGEGFFRFLPMSGVWDTLGGYTGVLPLFLILAGLFISPLRKKMPLRKELIFFLLAAAFIVLKNAGVYPFILLGGAPLFERVLSLRWAGPVWIFALSAAAAMGFGLVEAHLERSAEARDRGEKRGPIPAGAVFIPAAGIIGGLYFVYSFIPSVSLYMQSAAAFDDAMRPFVLPSVIGGSLLTLFVLGFAFYITWSWKDEKRNIYALIILAVLELWWWVPRGYAPETLLMKWLPLFAGFAALVFFFRQKMTFAFLGLAVFFGGAYLLDTMAPNGLPPFDDAFRPAPYVSAIRDDADGGRPRAAGAYGALFPNYASALRLDDVRYVNSVTPLEFRAFSSKYLSSRTGSGPAAAASWFSGRPVKTGGETIGAAGGETLDGQGMIGNGEAESPPEKDFLERERAYSFLGVKYLVFPPAGVGGSSDEALMTAFEEKFPLFYDSPDARVYKNPGALPRVFLVKDTLEARGWEEAQKMFMEGGFDPMAEVVIERGDDGPARGAAGSEDNAGDDRPRDDKSPANKKDGKRDGKRDDRKKADKKKEIKASAGSGPLGWLASAGEVFHEYLPGRPALAASSGEGAAAGGAGAMPPETLMKSPRKYGSAASSGASESLTAGPGKSLSDSQEKASSPAAAEPGPAPSKNAAKPADETVPAALKASSGAPSAPSGAEKSAAVPAGEAASKKEESAGQGKKDTSAGPSSEELKAPASLMTAPPKGPAPAGTAVAETPSEPAPTSTAGAVGSSGAQRPSAEKAPIMTTPKKAEETPQAMPAEKPALSPSPSEETVAGPMGGAQGEGKAAPAESAEAPVPGGATAETPPAETPPAAAVQTPAPLPPLEEGRARIIEYTEHKVVVEVNAEDESMLVLTDLYYPGWKAKVNDEKTEIVRVNGLVRGVPVKAGRSTVVFYYMPFYFILGVVLFGLGVIFSVVLIVRDIKGE